jgi:hypothetical protein
MSKRLNLVKIALALAVLGGGPVSQTGLARLLEGGVEHSENLAPVENSLRPGATYSQSKALAQQSVLRNHWYEVPEWLSGTWQQEESVQSDLLIYATNERSRKKVTHRDHSVRTYGDQVDQQGRIWSFDDCPFVVNGRYENKITYGIFRTFDPVEKTRDSITFKSLQTSVSVNPLTRQIETTVTKESITKFTALGKDKCSTESSVKVFDMNGQPLQLYEVKSVRDKIQPFTPRNEFDGEDLRAMLTQFLSQTDENAGRHNQ